MKRRKFIGLVGVAGGAVLSGCRLSGGRLAAFPLHAEVRVERGGPRLFVNGQETYPLLGTSTNLYPTIENFRRAGIHLYHPIVGLQACWKGPDEYDWSVFEHFYSELIARDAEACFLPRLQLNAPRWWKEANLDECIEYGQPFNARNYDLVRKAGLEPGEGGHPFRSGADLWEAAIVSEKWQADTEQAVRAMVRHFGSGTFGHRILGYHPTTGATGEWNYPGANFIPDYSAPMQQACGSVPSVDARTHSAHGLLRDPVAERDVIAFYDCYHDAIADAVIRFPRAIKEESHGRLLCGVYYGYILEQVRIQDGGYLASLKVFGEPSIDYIAGPYAYQPGNVTDENGVRLTMVDGGGNEYGHARGLAGDGGYRMLIDSVTRRGKLYISEMDPSTWLDENPHEVFGGAGGLGSDSVEGSLRSIRRDLGQMFVRGAGGWLYDFGPMNRSPNGWYADDRIIAEFRRFAELGRLRASLDLGSVSDVAVCVDDRTFSATHHWESERPWADYGIRFSDHFNHWFLNTQSRAIHRMGAPADFLHLADLGREEAGRYQLLVVPVAFRMDANEVDRVISALRGSGTTVVWCYAPGVISPDGLDTSQMRRLTGFEFEIASTPGTMMIDCTDEDILSTGVDRFGVDVERAPRFSVRAGTESRLGVWAGSNDVAFARREHEGFTSVFVGTAPMPAQLLRWLARSAGVGLWSTSADIVYASRDAAMIVATADGERTFELPHPLAQVAELENGPTSASGGEAMSVPAGAQRRFTMTLEKGESRLFVRPV